MYKHLLVPLDGSKLALRALDAAAELAKATGARITALTVEPSYPTIIAADGYMVEPISSDEWDKSMARHAERIRHGAEKRAAAAGVEIAFVSSVHDQPWEGIIETARKKKCDTIVMASHGRRGIAALVLGSETTKVLTHSRIPVLVCR